MKWRRLFRISINLWLVAMFGIQTTSQNFKYASVTSLEIEEDGNTESLGFESQSYTTVTYREME